MFTIVEDEGVRQKVDNACERWSRADDAWEAITWAIAHDHKVGEALTESGKTRGLSMQGARSIAMPTITIVYEIQAPYLIIRDVKFTEAVNVRHGNA